MGRRTVSLPTASVAAAVLLALGSPLCASAWAEGDGSAWDTSDTGDTWEESPPAASGTLELVPADAGPGTDVTVNTGGCAGDGKATGDAASVGAGAFHLAPATHEGDLVGRFKVPSGARPGTYPVSVTCEGGTVVRQTFVVSAKGGTQLQGVHAGDGGSVGRLGTVQLALGGLLIAGSLGAAGYYVRRRAQEA